MEEADRPAAAEPMVPIQTSRRRLLRWTLVAVAAVVGLAFGYIAGIAIFVLFEPGGEEVSAGALLAILILTVPTSIAVVVALARRLGRKLS